MLDKYEKCLLDIFSGYNIPVTKEIFSSLKEISTIKVKYNIIDGEFFVKKLTLK